MIHASVILLLGLARLSALVGIKMELEKKGHCASMDVSVDGLWGGSRNMPEYNTVFYEKTYSNSLCQSMNILDITRFSYINSKYNSP
jgi:hypothetical protein